MFLRKKISITAPLFLNYQCSSINSFLHILQDPTLSSKPRGMQDGFTINKKKKSRRPNWQPRHQRNIWSRKFSYGNENEPSRFFTLTWARHRHPVEAKTNFTMPKNLQQCCEDCCVIPQRREQNRNNSSEIEKSLWEDLEDFSASGFYSV